MTLAQDWTILIKHWKLVVICSLLVGVGANAGSKLMKPLYQSSALVQVVIRSGNYNQTSYDNLLASDQLVQTEASLATSDPVLREVASHYPGLSVIQLSGEVTSSPKTNTQLLEIDVMDPSPARAASLANDVAATLIKQQLRSIQQNSAQAQQQIRLNLDLTWQQIDETSSKISVLRATGGNQGQIALLEAQLSALQQLYSQWQTALAQVELTQEQSGNPLWVAQPAQPAASPVRSNILLNIGGGLLAGLLLGILLALLYERLETRVRLPEEITQLLAWPVLATIWQAKSSNREDVINPTGRNVNAEPFRILRTNIGFSNMYKPLHSMIVTSALRSEGKSVIAANLAIFWARAGKNTLLIDADLHHPMQHTLFDLSSNESGFSNAVLAISVPNVPRTSSFHEFNPNTSTQEQQGGSTTTKLSLEPFVHSVGIPNLWLMPSGPLPPSPSELFESKAMQDFLTEIANCGIDFVIFDTAPVLGLSDVSILASKVDGALVVVDTTRATKEKLKQTKTVLSRTGVHVPGCVANKLKHKRDDSTIYYFTEDQDSGEKSARNGHLPPVPVTPILAESPFEQRIPSS